MNENKPLTNNEWGFTKWQINCVLSAKEGLRKSLLDICCCDNIEINEVNELIDKWFDIGGGQK